MDVSHPRSKAAKYRLSGDRGLTVMKNSCSSKENKEGQIMETSCLLMICCAYALKTDGCREVSGMCQGTLIHFDISETIFMLHFNSYCAQ